MHAMLNAVEKAWSVLFLKACHLLLPSNSKRIGQYFYFLSEVLLISFKQDNTQQAAKQAITKSIT